MLDWLRLAICQPPYRRAKQVGWADRKIDRGPTLEGVDLVGEHALVLAQQRQVSALSTQRLSQAGTSPLRVANSA